MNNLRKLLSLITLITVASSPKIHACESLKQDNICTTIHDKEPLRNVTKLAAICGLIRLGHARAQLNSLKYIDPTKIAVNSVKRSGHAGLLMSTLCIASPVIAEICMIQHEAKYHNTKNIDLLNKETV